MRSYSWWAVLSLTPLFQANLFISNPPPQLLPSQKEVLHHLVPGNPPELCSAETEKASLGQFSSARLGQKHWPILQRTWK